MNEECHRKSSTIEQMKADSRGDANNDEDTEYLTLEEEIREIKRQMQNIEDTLDRLRRKKDHADEVIILILKNVVTSIMGQFIDISYCCEIKAVKTFVVEHNKYHRHILYFVC